MIRLSTSQGSVCVCQSRMLRACAYKARCAVGIAGAFSQSFHTSAMTWSTAYPAARRSDHVDVYQSQARGEVHVDDPYDWMEEHSSETEAWIHAQSALTNEFLAQNGDNARFKEDLRSSYNYPKLSFPKRYGTGAARRWYWFYNSGLQPKSVLYRSSTSACPDFSRGQPSDAETFFDQNLLSKDHTVALRKRVFSKCGRYFAYGVSKSASTRCYRCSIAHASPQGSDLQTIYVRPWDAPFCKALDGSVPSVAHGQDEIRGIKSTSLTWTHDSKGFFYSVRANPAWVVPFEPHLGLWRRC